MNNIITLENYMDKINGIRYINDFLKYLRNEIEEVEEYYNGMLFEQVIEEYIIGMNLKCPKCNTIYNDVYLYFKGKPNLIINNTSVSIDSCTLDLENEIKNFCENNKELLLKKDFIDKIELYKKNKESICITCNKKMECEYYKETIKDNKHIIMKYCRDYKNGST